MRKGSISPFGVVCGGGLLSEDPEECGEEGSEDGHHSVGAPLGNLVGARLPGLA